MIETSRFLPDDRALWALVLRLSRMPHGGLLSTLAQNGWFDEIGRILTADDPTVVRDVIMGHTALGAVEAEDLAHTWSVHLTAIGGLDAGQQDLDRMRVHGARIITCSDAEWPTRLHAGPDEGSTPCALWAMGPVRLDEAVERSVTITGARASTHYGQGVTTDLVQYLVPAGVGVISSGGFGIDAAAHRAALIAQRDGATARTVSVMGSGPDQFHPRANTELLQTLTENNLVISAEAPGTVPSRTRFIHRARLVGTLSRATVIIEAGRRSTSSVVASTARDLGRPVGAVPGPVTSATSVGTHQMIREHRDTLITSGADVLAMLDG